MTNRTVQIKGYGFGSSPAEITVTLEGTTVFTGAVTTVNEPPPTLPNLSLTQDTVTLCTVEIPVDFSGSKAMTCTVNNGTVVFAQIDANYVLVPNPVFSEFDYLALSSSSVPLYRKIEIISNYAVPPFTTEELAILNSTDPAVADEQLALIKSHGVEENVSGGSTVFEEVNIGEDPRENVMLNGVPAVIPNREEYPGIWWWKIDAGTTLSYDLVIDAGVE